LAYLYLAALNATSWWPVALCLLLR